MRLARQLKLLYLLTEKPVQSAKDLAGQLEVSPRTVYRDVEVLNLAGFPVFSTMGRNGGIGLAEGYTINKMVFSKEEQQELLLALQSYDSIKMGKSDLFQKLTSFFQQPLQDWIEIDFSSWDPHQQQQFETLRQAVLERDGVQFEYYGANKKPSYRSVYPLKLLFKSRSWYLSAFDLQREELRLFKLSRIHSLQLSQEKIPHTFVTPKEKSAKTSPYQSTHLVLLFTPETAYRIYDEFSKEQVRIQKDGSFLVDCFYPVDNWVMGWLLSFGEGLVGVQPAWLQEELKKKLNKMAERDYSMPELLS